MSHRTIYALVLLSALWHACAIASWAQTAPVLNPAKTWLFVVGVLKFADADTTSWDAKNRRDSQIVSLFRSRGVPSDHVVYINDTRATLNNIENQFQQLVARPQADDLLIVYYTGHGGDGSFETYDGESWPMKWIGKTIDRNFKGSEVLLIGDCCNSGSLEDVVNAKHEGIAYAAISSSARDEEGHGNWTCSQAVLDGLTGDPAVDTNHDGKISLRELGQHVQKEILAYENNHSVFTSSGGFDTQMIVANTAARTV